MDADRWNRVQALFDAALDQTPVERMEFLRLACGDDTGLMQEVVSLLEADEASDDLFEGLAMDALGVSDDTLLDFAFGSLIDKQVGHWRIVEPLGKGGMGAVYLAERAEGGYHQKAALKLLKRGIDSEDIFRRFRAERQILAHLHHPNIAQLYDGGITEDGLPYFAMEYVNGVPLDTYCDTHQLGVDARIRLFLEVCQAVQHAHRNLIIHRDLKPGNILVTEDGIPKLLDFGIAKVMDARANTGDISIAVTRTGFRVMTPEYASPEQVLGLAVNTTTDVYALGIILYELLTGHRPYPPTTGSPKDVEQAITSAEPIRPSTVVKKNRVSLTREEPLTPDIVGTARATSIPQLQQQLSGDLDAICLKALRKAPEERFASVEQFAEDLRRHTQHLPVHAHEWTTAYRVRKFVQRHRGGVWATVGVVLVLTLLTSIYTFSLLRERNRARMEAARAEQITNFLQTVFQAPTTGMGGSEVLTAQDLLQRGVVRIEEDLEGQPEAQAALWELIGNVFSNLGHTRDAVSLLERALAQRQRLYPPDHPAIIDNLSALGRAMQVGGQYDDAEQALWQAVALSEQAWGVADVRTARQQSYLAFLLHLNSKDEEAEQLQRTALATLLASQDETTPQIAEARQQLAVMLDAQGRTEEAWILMNEVIENQRTQWSNGHPRLASSLVLLGDLAVRQEHFARADSLYREALDMQNSLLGDTHAEVGTTLNHLAQSYVQQQRHGDAERVLQESMAVHLQAYGAVHPVTISTQRLLVQVLLLQQKEAEAEAALLTSHHALEMLPDNPMHGLVLEQLIDLYEERGQTAEAARYREML